MGTATRKAQARNAKVQSLSFSADRSAARKELLRMASTAQWTNRFPNPGRGPKSFHKPEQVTQSVFGNRRNPAVKSI